MKPIEVIICSVIMGVVCFLFGFFFVRITYKNKHFAIKHKEYHKPIDYDLKTSVNTSHLSDSKKSSIDGKTALDNFEIN